MTAQARQDGLRDVLSELMRRSQGARVDQHLLFLDMNETLRFTSRNPEALTEGERA